jgi:hypothetical protein
VSHHCSRGNMTSAVPPTASDNDDTRRRYCLPSRTASAIGRSFRACAQIQNIHKTRPAAAMSRQLDARRVCVAGTYPFKYFGDVLRVNRTLVGQIVVDNFFGNLPAAQSYEQSRAGTHNDDDDARWTCTAAASPWYQINLCTQRIVRWHLFQLQEWLAEPPATMQQDMSIMLQQHAS